MGSIGAGLVAGKEGPFIQVNRNLHGVKRLSIAHCLGMSTSVWGQGKHMRTIGL